MNVRTTSIVNIFVIKYVVTVNIKVLIMRLSDGNKGDAKSFFIQLWVLKLNNSYIFRKNRNELDTIGHNSIIRL